MGRRFRALLGYGRPRIEVGMSRSMKGPVQVPIGAFPDDLRLVEALRGGDEDAFCSLIERHHGPMLRLARTYVSSHAVAEEVVQETWMGVLTGLDRFEARSSLKTWIFRILTNIAKKRGAREGRTIPFSSLFDGASAPAEPAVEPERFLKAGRPRGWASFPVRWDAVPEARLLSSETLDCVEGAIAALPASQREVITLRDVDGLSGPEVCTILEISEGNQRILLHRARCKVRRAIELYLGEASA
jgi:RNA polymerase sigma-70 factor (ECF subfamily)